MPLNDLVTASRFKESRVQNHSNVVLGHVDEVVLDPAKGVITHVIVALADGPALAPAARVLVPWSALQPLYNDQALLLEASPQQAAAYPAPPFDLTHRGLWTGAPQGSGASGSFKV